MNKLYVRQNELKEYVHPRELEMGQFGVVTKCPDYYRGTERGIGSIFTYSTYFKHIVQVSYKGSFFNILVETLSEDWIVRILHSGETVEIKVG